MADQKFWTDNGTEYKNKAFKKFCISKEIAREFTVLETPEQNGVAERFNRTVVEAARCLLIDSKLPKNYWVRAVDTACYARNLVVKDKNTKSAFEKFFGRKPRSDHLKVFGCVAYSKNRDASKKSKFDPKATKCLFIGYSDNTTAYLLQNIKTRQIFTSRNVRFNENNIPGFHNETEDIEDSLLYLDLDEVREELQDTSNSSELSSEVELTETESVQESENNTETEVDQEIKEEKPSPSVKPKSKINVQFNPNVAVKNIERKPSKIPVPVKNSQQKKVKPPSRLQMIGKLGQIAIPSGDQKTFQLWSEYDEMKRLRKEAAQDRELKRSDRSRAPPERFGKSYSHAVQSTLTKNFIEPENFENAINSEQKDKWLEAMKTEIESLNETQTWDLVPKEKGQNIIPGRWVYKTKHDSNGNIDKFKARYVAKGFKQIEGIEYSDTFAPTSKPETFKILLALSAIENFFLKQMDVKSAYLHPKIDEEVYLEQPKGFEKLDSNGNKLVCKLKKSIYGLKQAAKNWYQELSNFLIQQGFEKSKLDYCLFLKNKEDEKLYVLTWVDDLVIAGNSQTEIDKLKSSLESKFKMNDRGDLEWFLGMRILKTEKGITLDQEKYTQNILEQFNMQDCKPSKTPAENNLKLEVAQEDSARVDSHEFRSLVGSLLYLAKQTRPDIMWITNVLSRFMNDPTVEHFNAGKRVLRYLQHTKSLRLFFPSTSNSTLVGETDADWSGDVNDRRSTTGYYFKLGDSGGSVSWQVKKQPTVSLSSCEAEYKGLAAAVQEAIFLRGLLRELRYEQFEPTTIGEDNQSCIKLATNPVLHKRSKHIDTKYHFIRERVDDNSIKLIYTPTDEMAADLLTKALPQQKVEQHREQLLGESRFLPSGNNLSGGIGAQKRT